MDNQISPSTRLVRPGRSGKRGRLLFRVIGFLALSATAFANAEAPSLEASPRSPRESYNEGTRRLREANWREAESWLQAAVASNDEAVQPPALYNLGHVRFAQGMALLREAPDAARTRGSGQRSGDSGDRAIQFADQALAGTEVEEIVAAYLNGRGARKELKAAQAAVRQALDSHGAVLSRWQRASGDFRSAYELRPEHTDARVNADLVDRHLAQLVDLFQNLQALAARLGQKQQDLRQRMEALKKRMPEGKRQQLGADDEEDEEDNPPKEPKSGQQEAPSRQGKQRLLTWEEAAGLLESLKLDANRKLPMGSQQTAPPKDRRRKEW